MMKKINVFYELLFNDFKFEVGTNGLKVHPPVKISSELKTFAKKFITDNKEFIISVLKRNQNLQSILLFDSNDILIPLSYAQERLWFIEQYEQGTNAYHIPLAFELDKSVEIESLKKAIQSIVERHEVFRTVFKKNEEGIDCQQIEKKTLNIIEEKTSIEMLSDELARAINKPFNLTADYPIKVWFYTITDSDRTIMMINIHHIAFDGWSIDIFMKELWEYYLHHLEKRALTLTSLSIQYKEFSIWQRAWLSGERLEQQVNYWQKKLTDYEPLALLTDYVRPCLIDYHGDDYHFDISESTSLKLRTLAQSNGVTLFTVLLSGFYILLSKYTGQEDLIIGTPIANRHYAQTEGLIGFFVNSLALRMQLQSDFTIEKLIDHVHQNLIEAQIHQDLPFEKLVEQLKAAKDQSRHPIFQVMFGVQNFNESGEMSKLFKPFSIQEHYKIATFDLSLFIDDSQLTLKGGINYATSLYKKETIQRLSVHYQTVLEQMTDNIELKIKNLQLLSQPEYQKIVYNWNSKDRFYSGSVTLHRMFEEQVTRTPNNIAVAFGEQKITYKELNEKSNQFARYIQQECEIKSDILVALCLDRSLEMIIAILGVLKSGAAYVPIDPLYPQDRIQFYLNDTKSTLLITQTNLQSKLQHLAKIKQIHIDDRPYQNQATENLFVQSQSIDLAYVIYTSGTTGLPKGVMVEHGSITDRMIGLLDCYSINEEIRYLHASSYSFDASLEELFLPLLVGATMVMAPSGAQIRMDVVAELIEKFQINTINFVPSLFKAFIDYVEVNPRVNCSSLKQIISGGEALCLDTLQKSFKHIKATVFNTYGPTENTIDTTAMKYLHNSTPSRITIGYPLVNTKVYILDSHKNIVPIGVAGELYVGGRGLARGYLNRPELTADKFIDKLSDEINERLYRTGDLVRYLENGEIEYLGRIDEQVKLRGYRIEPAEIEQVLSSYKEIKQNIVLLRTKETSQGVNKFLAAYYVSDTVIDPNVLRNHLAASLPQYMIPSVFVYMESFPISVNGKLDKKALPNPDFTPEECSYVAPRTELESQICSVWKAVLGVEQIGIKDDFFSLGGDSILSIQLTSRLRAHGILCSVKDIFEQRTIERLALHFNREIKQVEINAEQGVLDGSFSFLPIQAWFFEQNFKKLNHWNQSFMIVVPPLSIKRLEKVLPKLVQQHDMLRVAYLKNTNGFIGQTYHPKLDIANINCLDLSDFPEEKKAEVLSQALTFWQSYFDIENGLLWQIGYIHGYEDGSARLFFAMHHLITDAVSWRILIDDIKRLYEGHELGQKTSSYRQWVNVVKNYVQENQHEIRYWQAQIKEPPTFNHYYNISKRFKKECFHLEKQVTQALIGRAGQAYHTEINDLLLTALAYTLNACFGSRSTVITLEGHGRENLNETIDLSRTVGWFTTMYPVKLSVKDNLSESIKCIKEHLRQVPNKGIGYGAFKYGNQNLDLTLPPICFNYLGQFDDHDATGWQIVNDFTGISIHSDNIEDNLITMNGMVVNGELIFNIITMLEIPENQQLSCVYKTKLIEIIKHCVEKIDNDQLTYTPSDFKSILISPHLLDSLQSRFKIEEIYPANSLQQGFIYHALSQPTDDAYRVQVLFDYRSEINISYYKQAWRLAIQKYPALRTCFNWEENLIQIITKSDDLCFTEHDLSYVSDKDRAIKIIQKQDRSEAFDLTQPSLLRLHLIKLAHNRFTLLQSMHHSIIDGWSGPILQSTVHEYYYQLIKGSLPKVKEDSAYFLVQAYIAKHRRNAEIYWQTAVSKIKVVNDLNVLLSHETDLNNIKALTTPKMESIQVEDTDYLAIKELVKREGLTVSVLIQFAWHKLIQIYTRDTQTIVGTTVSGRNIPVSGIEESVGLYINTLPLIVEWDESQSIRSHLQLIHGQVTALNNNNLVNLADIQKYGKRLFHSLLIFENYPAPEEKKNDGEILQFSIRESIQKLDYPLAIMAYEINNTLHVILKYDEAHLAEAKAQKLINELRLIIKQLPSRINECAGSISLLSIDDYHRIVYDWNANNDINYAQDKTIQQLFEEQVERTPNKIAMVFKDQCLTYQELNEQSNQLARYIKQQYGTQSESNYSLKPDTLIALCMNRSSDMVIAILGVLKAGAAYVPIAPNYPAERIQYLLADSNSSMLLTETTLLAKLETLMLKIKLITLDDKPYHNQAKTNLPLYNGPNDLAYVIYTSGSTGRPKGVLITHLSFTRLINSFSSLGLINKSVIAESMVTLSLTNYVFDIFGLEYGLTFAFGGVLILSDMSNAKNDFIKNKVTLIQQTPSVWKQLLNILPCDEMQKVICLIGGERAELFLMQALKMACKAVLNVYGPTETTIWSTSYVYDGSSRNSVIGKPLSNQRVYVLNTNKIPVPIGVIGELYIAGSGLARGYLNQPELTSKYFIQNLFATEFDNGYTKLYKTGDLVRWLPDGNLEYVGRNDEQVKIHGYRIELSEIEHVLSRYKTINQSVVVTHEKQTEHGLNKYLVAYYVSNEVINNEELKRHLSKILPDYMVPHICIPISQLPLTINGKLDRNSLPVPHCSVNAVTYVAPRTAIEEQMCSIWQSILGVDKIGIYDDFFRLGGNSILAIQLISKMNKVLNTNIALADIFRHKHISQLSEWLINTSSEFLLIKSLSTKNKMLPKIYFFHPGAGGCEVYQSLANLLENDYQSIGVDNYNIFYEDKIASLSGLANFYINEIEQAFPFSENINLCGWSLGGQIALEIAFILEQKGFKKIKVYLLDTILADEHLKSLRLALDIKNIHNFIKEDLLKKGYERDYIKKICNAYDAEKYIMNDSISGMLHHTEVILFKATKISKVVNVENYLKMEEYTCSIRDNNVQSVLFNPMKIIMIDCSHSQIVKEEKEIIGLLREY